MQRKDVAYECGKRGLSVDSSQAECMPTKRSQFGQSPYQQIAFIPQVYLTEEMMESDPLSLLTALQEKYKAYGGIKLITPPSWHPNPNLSFHRFNNFSLPTRLQPLYLLTQGKPFIEDKSRDSYANFITFANQFGDNYQFRFPPRGKSKEARLEHEYWSLVLTPKTEKKYEVIVKYAADLPTSKYGSGFPISINNSNTITRSKGNTTRRAYTISNHSNTNTNTNTNNISTNNRRTTKSNSHNSHNSNNSNKKSSNKNNTNTNGNNTITTTTSTFDYCSSLFNLNNIYKSPSSLLAMGEARGEQIGGITVPWVYVGMQFSTFCWHVQDCEINSLNYSHKGATKVWYFIPGAEKDLFDAHFARQHKHPSLEKMTYMMDPLELRRHNITVHKAYQKPGEYICTFLHAYHCGFSTGLNIGEAVNFLTLASLPLIRTEHKSIFDYQWVVCANYHRNQHLKHALQHKYKEVVRKEEQALLQCLRNTPISLVHTFSDQCKFDKHVCRECMRYNYLYYKKCVHCQQVYCLSHACTHSLFTLHIREPKGERQKTYLKLLEITKK